MPPKNNKWTRLREDNARLRKRVAELEELFVPAVKTVGVDESPARVRQMTLNLVDDDTPLEEFVPDDPRSPLSDVAESDDGA